MTTTNQTRTRFPLGRLLATRGVLELGVDLWALLPRHARGDWGDLEAEDRAANDRAVRFGGRIFSAYTVPQGRVCIITEADRSATTALLPDETDLARAFGLVPPGEVDSLISSGVRRRVVPDTHSEEGHSGSVRRRVFRVGSGGGDACAGLGQRGPQDRLPPCPQPPDVRGTDAR
jgi:hypothetical protein